MRKMGTKGNRIRGLKRTVRKGWVLMLSLIAAVILLGLLMKIGLPSIKGSQSAAIKQSLIADAQSAINAEGLIYAATGEYASRNTSNTYDYPEKYYIDYNNQDIKATLSPHNSVKITTGENGSCFTVEVTNNQLSDVEAYYTNCNGSNMAAPVIQKVQSSSSSSSSSS